MIAQALGNGALVVTCVLGNGKDLRSTGFASNAVRRAKRGSRGGAALHHRTHAIDGFIPVSLVLQFHG